MASSVYDIASQGVQIMKRNRFHSKNKSAKGDDNCQNDLAMCFTGYLSTNIQYENLFWLKQCTLMRSAEPSVADCYNHLVVQ